MEPRRIRIYTGPCGIESYAQIMGIGYNVGLVHKAVKPFGIDVYQRGEAWKPRTKFFNGKGVKEFEGVGEIGLKWAAESAVKNDLPIVSECMSEADLRYFSHYLEPERDVIQIGARDNQAFALLYAVGGMPFGVMLKNPQHGIDTKEAVGSLERFARNRELIYCTRGQHKFIDPDDLNDEAFGRLGAEMSGRPTQHPDARNYSNIGAIRMLRGVPYFSEKGVLLCHDPSHTWGGNNDLMRRRIGEQAIKAVTEYGYDGIMVEAYDASSYAKVDGDQALLTTTKGVDWSKTNAGQGPGVKPNAGREPEIMPITLVDIASALVDYQAKKLGIGPEEVAAAKKKLDEISWIETPPHLQLVY